MTGQMRPSLKKCSKNLSGLIMDVNGTYLTIQENMRDHISMRIVDQHNY
jgi:hypothetical protein